MAPIAQIHFAPVPPNSIRHQIPNQHTPTFLTSWISGLTHLSKLSDADFSKQLSTNQSLQSFLTSYIVNDDTTNTDDNDWLYSLTNDQPLHLRRSIAQCFTRAAQLGTLATLLTSHQDIIIRLPAIFFSNGARTLIQTITTNKKSNAISLDDEFKVYTSRLLEDVTESSKAVQSLQETTYFLMTNPSSSYTLLSGEEFFDTVTTIYGKLATSSDSTLTPHKLSIVLELRRLLYTTLIASTQAEPRLDGAIVDFLFSLINNADGEAAAQSDKLKSPKYNYLASIVSTTSLLSKLSAATSSTKNARWTTAIQRLKRFEISNGNFTKIPKLHRIKRKSSRPSSSHGQLTEQQSHDLAQLQELFPDLTLEVLSATLESHSYDLTSATSALLDGQISLPEASSSSSSKPTSSSYPEQPSSDIDSLLTAPTSRLYLGKRNLTGTADSLLTDRSTAPSKSKILQALEAFDSDDDERDDTYDADDIGGAVATGTTAVDADADSIVGTDSVDDDKLYKAFLKDPTVFNRDAFTRRGKERAALRETTGLSNEAIEGWRVMLERDGGKKLRTLEVRFAREAGVGDNLTQTPVGRTAWRAPAAGEEGEGADGEQQQRGGDNARGRGQGRGGGGFRGGRGRGRGGGPPPTEAQQRARKDKNKAAVGNHNRKAGHAKKMARGGFPGS